MQGDKMTTDKQKMEMLAKKILEAKSVALFCHQSPDADALGSCGALKLALEKLGKSVEIFCEDNIPKNLEYLDVSLCNDKTKLTNYEVFCLVDGCGAYRTGSFEPYFDKAKIKLCIDHHQIEGYKFVCAFQDPTYASACDIVMEFIPFLDIKIDSKMATLLYAGITSDTDRFLYPSPKVGLSLKHASQLVALGADMNKVNFNSFRKKRKDYSLFLKKFLKHTKTYFDGKLFLTTITHSEYKKNKEMWDENNCSKLLDWIDGCEITVVAIAKEKGRFHLNFRSVGDINVGNIALNFDGGGHKNASGGEFFGNARKMKRMVLNECLKHLSK
jgi:bifunctional oligoribonuclease and PAP phosphatase NrnA